MSFRRRLSALALAGVALAAAAGCATNVASDSTGRVVVVDTRGQPVAGALVLPDPEDQSTATAAGPPVDDLKAVTTDAAGSVVLPLGDYYWTEDSCYHFRVVRRGYDPVIMSVSRELWPAVLRVELKLVGQP
jgi:hypothetical protein